VYHPNIDLEGNVCLNILREDWKPVLNINTVIYGLFHLFTVTSSPWPMILHWCYYLGPSNLKTCFALFVSHRNPITRILWTMKQLQCWGITRRRSSIMSEGQWWVAKLAKPHFLAACSMTLVRFHSPFLLLKFFVLSTLVHWDQEILGNFWMFLNINLTPLPHNSFSIHYQIIAR